MISEFQVLYTLNGEPRTLLVRAEHPDDAMALVAKAGVQVASVSPGKPVVDWSKPTLSVEEAAVYLDCSTAHIRDLQAAGRLPRPNKWGDSVFTLRTVENYRREHMKEQAA